jgi:HAD superfamily hydrolase (TIGR01509 family)
VFVPAPRAVLIDAGFTLISYDGARIAAIAAERGVTVQAAAIEATERSIRAELAQHDWPQQPGSVASPGGGARFLRRVLELAAAGDAGAELDGAAELLWARHLEHNLWSRPLDGVVAALEALGQAGLRLAVVSNSEGTLAALLDRMDLTRHFQVVIDSWVVGVTKPDPRIFHAALERLRVRPEEAVMVGDSLKADVEGARAAGVRAALVDPCDLYLGADVPRFPSFAAFAAAVIASL